MRFVGGPLDGEEMPESRGAWIEQPVLLSHKVLRSYLIGFDQWDRPVTYTVHPEDFPEDAVPYERFNLARYDYYGNYLGIRARCSDRDCPRCPMEVEWDG